jgi:integrase
MNEGGDEHGDETRGLTVHITQAITTYTRMKVERGDWWGETITKFRSHLWDFALALPPAVAANITRVKADHLRMWVHNPAHSIAYRRNRLVAVRGMFRWLHADGRIPRDPTVGVTAGQVPESTPRSFSDDEVEQLFAVACRDPRELLCVSLCWNEGVRRSEVAKALIEDVVWRTSTMAIRGKLYRGRVSRTIALSPETVEAMKGYLVSEPAGAGPLVRSRRVGGGPLTSHGVGQIISVVIKDAGLKWFPFDGRSSHAGRHTSATQALEAGAEPELIKRQHGWQSDAMLHRYTKAAALDLHRIHVLRAERRSAIETMNA